jgi:hypothetical protein
VDQKSVVWGGVLASYRGSREVAKMGDAVKPGSIEDFERRYRVKPTEVTRQIERDVKERKPRGAAEHGGGTVGQPLVISAVKEAPPGSKVQQHRTRPQ